MRCQSQTRSPDRAVDILTVAQRSARMRLIRSKNTTPERILRSALHKNGFRFRLHSSDLPGRPDIVFPSRRKAIFVHGCFWHQHQGCRLGRTPKTKLRYWLPKLAGNKIRDRIARRKLAGLGWRSLVVWECEMRRSDEGISRAVKFLRSRSKRGASKKT